MSKKPTQKEVVENMLREHGEVDNFWAFHNYILRLGAIIHTLRQEGWEIEGMYGKERGFDRAFHKNYYYVLKSKLDEENTNQAEAEDARGPELSPMHSDGNGPRENRLASQSDIRREPSERRVVHPTTATLFA